MNIYNLIQRHQIGSYTEANQFAKIKFSVATKEGENFYQEYIPFQCKDYFAELVLSRYLNNIPGKIYGFECKEVWSSDPYITIASERESEREGLLKYFHLINELEEDLGVEGSERSEIYGSTLLNTFIIKVSPIWIYCPTMMSFFTLALRSLAVINIKDPQGTYETLDSIFDYLSDNSNNEYDYELYRYLNNDHFNWRFFLNNYKEIFGDDKLTGVNDAQFLEVFNRDLLLFTLKFKDTPEKSTDWRVSYNHNSTGTYTLSHCISRGWDKGIGRTWVQNYLALVK